jgi:hypothetical protein
VGVAQITKQSHPIEKDKDFMYWLNKLGKALDIGSWIFPVSIGILFLIFICICCCICHICKRRKLRNEIEK